MSSMSDSGRWPVLLSSRAIRELRHIGRDETTFDIVRKKFQELSHGQFTADNHLCIRGTRESIPIYRARASNDLRIIYQIDLVADGNAQFDHQVIKVYSVSSRNQVAYDFWGKVSRYLLRYGPEYRSRCIARRNRKDGNSSDKVPEVFEHRKYSNAFVDEKYHFDGEADMTELHETLAVEKFTPITKSLYNSILADMEVVLPIALNPDERRIVKHQGTSIVIGRSGTGKTTALIYKMRANNQAAVVDERPVRQLFVTRSRVLTRHIAHNYHGLIDSNEIANKTREELAEIRRCNEQERKRELVEYDNLVDFRDDLPERFSQLQDRHFPLFVSFDKLCSLLEADAVALEGRRFQTYPLLSFDDFKYSYWPKINHVLTRNLDPSLVFSEILGVIKGHGEDLSEESYLESLSHKRSPLLLNVRDRVYAIFEAYSKQCRIRNQIDTADRTRAILKFHEQHPFPKSSQVDYIFVDEVQDQLMLDIHLLQSLCKNPDGGYWCGDTAQTISVGSSFRIKDLKAFVYDDMMSYQRSNRQRKAPAPFATFELTTNFRSHSGIVRYAASLVELIYTMFPDSIDHMAPETANTSGRAPLLFISPTNDHSVFLRHLLSKDIPFGAHQGIIVRSQETADRLTKQLQKRCTVLTLLETKGLEFDDIILYNFFSESEAPDSWESILALASHDEGGRVTYDKNTVPPSTSPILCAELKQLYVAVTRARYRCWIWDSGDAINLMKIFWSDPGLISVSESLESIGSFAVSTKDLREWARRGQELFSNGLYVQAKSCFEQAGQSDEAEIADAYIQMMEARRNQDKSRYRRAASSMESCARRSDTGKTANVLWHHAASCFEGAQDIPNASRCYRTGRFYDRAASLSFEHQLFDDTLLTILPYSHAMSIPTYEKIRDVCRMHYLRISNYEKLRKLFDNDQSACIEYARSSGFSVQHKELLKQGGRTEDLANVYLEEGSPADAVECLLKSTAREAAMKRAKTITSDYFWLNLALDSTPDEKVCEQALRLFGLAGQFEGSDPRGLMDLDLTLFKASLGQSVIDLELLERVDLAQPEQKHRLLLGYHHALKAKRWLKLPTNIDVILKYLDAWIAYTGGIYEMTRIPKPSQSSHVQKLLGCSTPSKKLRNGTLINVAASSFLYQCAKSRRVRIDQRASRGDNLVSGADADRLIKQELAERTNSRLLDLHRDLVDVALLKSPASEGIGHATNSRTLEAQMRIVYRAAVILNPIKLQIPSGFANLIKNTVESTWVSKAFDLLHPISGMIQGFSATNEPKNEQDPSKTLYEWTTNYTRCINPAGDCPELFLSMFVMGLTLSYDLGRRHGCRNEKFSLPQYQQSVLCHDCSSPPYSITVGLLGLIRREGDSRIVKGINVLRHIIDNELAIDLPVLILLLELVVREAILAERVAASPQLLDGISGLVMPKSWTQDLMSYPSQLTPHMFKVGPLQEFVGCIAGVVLRIQDEMPAFWNPLQKKYLDYDILFLSIRMCWCIALIIVNIDSSHRNLQAILQTLQKCISKLSRMLEHESLGNEIKIRTILQRMMAIRDQPTCLSALVDTIQHEELVLLNRQGDSRYIATKKPPVSKVITFHNWGSLRKGVLGQLETKEPTRDSLDQGGESDLDTPQDHFPVAANHQIPSSPRKSSKDLDKMPLEEAKTAFNPPETDDAPQPSEPDTTTLEKKAQAVKRMQTIWRHQRKLKQLAESSNHSIEGEYYERLSPLISKRVPGKSPRARLFRRLFCGPGLLILVSLDMIFEQLEYALENLREEFKNPEIDAKAIVVLQERQKILEGYQTASDKLRKELSPDSPGDAFKVSNVAGIKGRMRQFMKTWFEKIFECDDLRDKDVVDEAKELLLRGVEAIQKS